MKKKQILLPFLRKYYCKFYLFRLLFVYWHIYWILSRIWLGYYYQILHIFHFLPFKIFLEFIEIHTFTLVFRKIQPKLWENPTVMPNTQQVTKMLVTPYYGVFQMLPLLVINLFSPWTWLFIRWPTLWSVCRKSTAMALHEDIASRRGRRKVVEKWYSRKSW